MVRGQGLAVHGRDESRPLWRGTILLGIGKTMNWPEDFMNKIICGDCLGVMKEMPDECVDLVLTDPPYGISGQGKVNYTSQGLTKVDYGFSDFKLIDLLCLLPKIKNKGSIVLFYDSKEVTSVWNLLKANGFKPKQLIYWFKGYRGINPRHGFNSVVEVAIWAVKSTGWTWNGGGNIPNLYIEKLRKLAYPPNNLHPTQKSLEVITWLIGLLSNENDTVFDPYLGSGTTTKACKEMRRNFIGIEINPEYCKIAEERLAQGVL